MEPDTDFTNDKSPANHLVVVMLGLLLTALFGGYIYYGMERAKMAAVSDLVAETEPDVSQTTVDNNGMTPAKKQEILDALSDSTISVLPEAEKAKILDSLSDTDMSGSQMTEDKKAKILEQLRDS